MPRVRVHPDGVPAIPPPPPGLPPLDVPAVPADGIEGTLVDWYWTDRAAGRWCGVVDYRRGSHAYCAGIDGAHLTRLDDE